MSFESLAGEFASEAASLLDALEASLLAVERAAGDAERAASAHAARRSLHTLKGNAGFLGAQALQQALHHMEDLAGALDEGSEPCAPLLAALDCLREEVERLGAGGAIGEPLPEVLALASGELAVRQPRAERQGEATLKVPQSRLDLLVAAAGELLVQNTRLQAIATGAAPREALPAVADAMDRSLRRLHELVLRVRTTSLGHLFAKLERIVRDEARDQGREVELVPRGQQVELDKAVLDQLAGALGHLVRNAVVHGIESPQERTARGKAARGRIVVSARPLGDRVEIVVEDDGRGLDREAIAARAASLGLRPAPAEELIFEPGFTTSALSRSAGRGVGLDAVRRTITALGGVLEVSSAGEGTRFTLNVPTSIAVQKAVLCRIAEEIFALPAASVVLARRVDDAQVRWIGAGKAVEHDGGLVPMVDAAELLGCSPERGEFAVFVQAGPLAAMRVDQLLGQQDFVFQPLEPMVRGRAPASAAGMLGDGRLVLRLEPERLVSAALATHAEARS